MHFSSRFLNVIILSIAGLPLFACSARLAALNVAFGGSTLTFSPAQTPIEIVQGTKATNVFSFTADGSFKGRLELSTSGLPTGVSASWSSTHVAIHGGMGASTLTLAPKINVVAGKYTFTVTASADELSVTQRYTLTVKPTTGIEVDTPPDIVVSSTGTASTKVSATIMPGVSVPRGGSGCSGSIISTLPAGISASLEQAVR